MTITFSHEVEALLRRQAEEAGKDPAEYAAMLVERVLRYRRLDRELAPAKEAFRRGWLTEDELGEELERAKHVMRAEQPRKAS